MYLECKKCLCSRTGDKLGNPCQTPGCDGIVTEVPDFKTLVDELPEAMTCRRRFDVYPGGIPAHPDRGENQDHWERFKSNGNRVCSYCGSLHPDDMFALVKLAADAPEDATYGTVPEIDPSDKNYKIYVRQPGVRNASEGGIKFYTHHLPRTPDGKINVTDQQNEEYSRAVEATNRRMMKSFSRRG